jgi:hypothetical protein
VVSAASQHEEEAVRGVDLHEDVDDYLYLGVVLLFVDISAFSVLCIRCSSYQG